MRIAISASTLLAAALLWVPLYAQERVDVAPILELERRGNGSFSYPSIIQDPKGMMHVTYTYSVRKGKSIKYATFNEAWVHQGNPKKAGEQ